MNTIKTWQERCSTDPTFPSSDKAMQAEIVELRAALAARATPSQPVGDLAAALDAAYPIPDSPHTSVKQRAEADRVAFRKGWEAHSQPSPSSVGAAIRALPLPEPWERGDGNYEDKYLESQVREFRSEAAALAEQVQGQQWISVSDRMPESGKRVVFAWTNQLGKARTSMGQWNGKKEIVANSCDEDACEYDEELDEYYLLEGWQEWGWELEFSAYVEDKVTHWMPLPSAPSIAQDGQKSEARDGDK